jgi:hypothetical protein
MGGDDWGSFQGLLTGQWRERETQSTQDPLSALALFFSCTNRKVFPARAVIPPADRPLFCEKERRRRQVLHLQLPPLPFPPPMRAS